MRKNPGCAFGPCNDSAQVGGPGCHLCDDIATLPQKGRGVIVDDVTPAIGEVDDTLALSAEAPTTTKKAKKTAATKRSGGGKRGAQPGRLFT